MPIPKYNVKPVLTLKKSPLWITNNLSCASILDQFVLSSSSIGFYGGLPILHSTMINVNCLLICGITYLVDTTYNLIPHGLEFYAY